MIFASLINFIKIMILDEFIDKDTCGKNRLFCNISCNTCNSVFKRQKRQVTTHFCSSFCANIAKGLYVKLACDHCSDEFYKLKSKLAGSKSGKYFCGRKCKDLAQKYMLEIQPDHYGTGDGVHSYRRLALANLPNICGSCGYSNILALEVHHKDRDRANNDISNLEILCANCHSIKHKMGL